MTEPLCLAPRETAPRETAPVTEPRDPLGPRSRTDGILGPRSPLWWRLALLAWAALAIAVTVKTAVDPSSHTTFPSFAEGPRDWWARRPLYEDRAFLYSPTFAVVISPFAALGDRWGGIAWNLAQIAALLLALRSFLRDVLPGSWCPRDRALLVLLSLAGTLRGVWAGQSNGFLIAAALLAASAIVRRRWWLAAGLLIAAFYVKLWPAALALLLLASYPRRLFARLATWAVALGLLPFLTASPAWVVDQYHGWYEQLRGFSEVRLPGIRDARTILEHVAPGGDLGLYPILQAASAGLVLVWCLWRRRREPSERRVLAETIAIWAAWQLLFGPGSERNTYGILGPPTSWAVIVSFRAGRLRLLATTSWLVLLLFGSSGSLERALMPVLSASPAILPAGVIAFAGWLALRARVDEGEETSPPEGSTR